MAAVLPFFPPRLRASLFVLLGFTLPFSARAQDAGDGPSIDVPAHHWIYYVTHGGPIILLLFLLIAGFTVLFIIRRFRALWRGASKPSLRLWAWAFLPLFLASGLAEIMFMRGEVIVRFSYGGLWDGDFRSLHGVYLALGFGAICSALNLLVLSIPPRR